MNVGPRLPQLACQLVYQMVYGVEGKDVLNHAIGQHGVQKLRASILERKAALRNPEPPVDQIDKLMRIVAEATDKEQEMMRGEAD